MNLQYKIVKSLIYNLNNMNTRNMYMNKQFIPLTSISLQGG